jgi:hypothetical protein
MAAPRHRRSMPRRVAIRSASSGKEASLTREPRLLSSSMSYYIKLGSKFRDAELRDGEAAAGILAGDHQGA